MPSNGHPTSPPSLTTLSPTQSPPSPKTINIVLIGAGISGLALTIGLLKYPHIRITIYESAPRFEELGAGIGFGRNATNAMKLIDGRIYEGFLGIATRSWEWFGFWWGGKGGVLEAGSGRQIGEDELLVRLGVDGKHSAGVEVSGGEKEEVDIEGDEGALNTVHRKDFLDVLVRLIPPGTAIFNKRAVSISPSPSSHVTITFQDGTSAIADAVIGCDGIRSITRGFVLGLANPATKPVFSGKYCYRGLVDMEKAKEVLGKRAGKLQMFLGRGGHVLTFPVEGGRTMNVVGHRTSPDGKWEHPSWIRKVTKEDMLKDYDGHSETIRKVLSMMDDEPLQWALFDHPPAPTYFSSHSPICLLGDAAHACTPHQGAGAGQALEDTYILSNLLGSCTSASSLINAFAAYDKVRRPRTQKVVETSRARGRFLSLEEGGIWVQGAARKDLDLGKIEEELTGRLGMGWIWDVDLEKESEKGMAIFKESVTGELGV